MRLLPWRLAITLSALLLFAAACGGGDDGGSGDNEDNLLSDGGFEDEADGWQARGAAPLTTMEQAAGGSASVVARIDPDAEFAASFSDIIFQDLNADRLPDILSGDYYVEEWVEGAEAQYIDVTVILFGSGTDMPQCPGGGICPNIQLRYVLAGVEEPPIDVENARFVLLGSGPPETGRWVHFETRVDEDFALHWSPVPRQIDSLRVLLEVRYDDRGLEGEPPAAEVYFDNLYFGPE
jgi:hypothetical protein